MLGSFKIEVYTYVGLVQNLKDPMDHREVDCAIRIGQGLLNT